MLRLLASSNHSLSMSSAYVNEAWSYSHKKQTLFSRLYDKMSMNAVKKADYVLNEGIASTQFMISQGISPAEMPFMANGFGRFID